MKYISLKRFKNEILKSNASHKVTALSLAIGVWLAFSPFPGLHLVITFIILRVFKLNGMVLLAGVLIHNPWTMIFIHLSGLSMGDLILSGSLESLEQFKLFPWDELGLRTAFSLDFWRENGGLLKGFVKPFVTGSIVLASGLSYSAYRLTLRFLRRASEKTV